MQSVPHLDMTPHIGVGVDYRIVAHLGAAIDDRKRHDSHIPTDFRVVRDIGQGAEDPFHLFPGTEQFQQGRESLARVFHAEDRAVAQFPFAVGQDHGASTAFPANLHIRLDGKGNLRRARFHEAIHAGNLQVRRVFQGSVQKCGQFL